MKTIKETVISYQRMGMTKIQAENYMAQAIILRKIATSPLADKVLLKGGVVMFNLSKNLRRATSDLDFDFIRYDISDESIKRFITILSQQGEDCVISLKKISPLKHNNYKGKRVIILISDRSYKIFFKMF